MAAIVSTGPVGEAELIQGRFEPYMHEKEFCLCSCSKIKARTFFILIRASGAVAVARLQSVVSSGPPERRTGP